MSMRDLVKGTARQLLGVLPDALVARVLPGRLGWDDSAMQVARSAATTPVRLLIAPVNSAGQAHAWARAAEQHLAGVSAVNMMTTNAQTARFAFPSDVEVPEAGYVFAGGWQRRQRAAIESDFTHVLLESGRFLYGSVPNRTPEWAVSQLAERGLRIALLWHGTDVRVPSIHAAWEPDSPFGERGELSGGHARVLERNARERREMFADSGYQSFVSTPGLLDLPDSRWLPVVVDPERWLGGEEPLRAPTPVVAYVPSNSPMKGGPEIDEQLQALDEAGLIRYRRLQGIPSDQMPEVYRQADIVLDQFRLGDYGVAACEAMAAGRVVIGHVHDDVRARVLELTGRALPIVESRYPRVGETIREILADRAVARRTAAEGPRYVRAVHDGRMSAAALAGFLGAPTTDAEKHRD